MIPNCLLPVYEASRSLFCEPVRELVPPIRRHLLARKRGSIYVIVQPERSSNSGICGSSQRFWRVFREANGHAKRPIYPTSGRAESRKYALWNRPAQTFKLRALNRCTVESRDIKCSAANSCQERFSENGWSFFKGQRLEAGRLYGVKRLHSLGVRFARVERWQDGLASTGIQP